VTPSRQLLHAAAAGAAALALLACGATGGSGPAASPAVAATDSKAADLRAHLDSLLGEHALLSAKATDAAMAGRTDEYAAYAGLLTRNGTDMGDLLGGALGADAQNRFDQLWAAHDTAVVQYTAGAAAQDRAAQDRAVQQLSTGFVPQFADLFSSVAGLPRDSLTEIAKDHVQSIKQLVDDQGRKNWAAVYADTRYAYADMQEMGDTLGMAIARKQASRLPGSASGKAVDLRVKLDQLLQEHLYLATSATDAAIAGRTDQFQAADKALNDNGADLGKALGAVSGPDAQSQFDRLWTAHDASFVDYTMAVARSDRASQDRAAADLNSVYVPQLAAFLAGATGLSRDALTNLLEEHVATTKDVVDAQGAHDLGSAARKDRVAAQHMAMIGDPVAAAIVKKLPQKFR
jgi:hypothetical protein